MVADFINFLAQASTITAIVAYIFGLWAALVVWTWFDISSRTDNYLFRLGAIVLVALGFLLGFVIYLILRPAQTKAELDFRSLEEKVFEAQSRASICYNCGSVIEPEFLYCATCGVQVKKVCNHCERQINHTWFVCPYCSHPQPELSGDIIEEVEKGETPVGILTRFAFFSQIKNIKVPIFSLRRGGRRRGRPRKEKPEIQTQSKRSRGRPRKEITPSTTEA